MVIYVLYNKKYKGLIIMSKIRIKRFLAHVIDFDIRYNCSSNTSKSNQRAINNIFIELFPNKANSKTTNNIKNTLNCILANLFNAMIDNSAVQIPRLTNWYSKHKLILPKYINYPNVIKVIDRLNDLHVVHEHPHINSKENPSLNRHTTYEPLLSLCDYIDELNFNTIEANKQTPLTILKDINKKPIKLPRIEFVSDINKQHKTYREFINRYEFTLPVINNDITEYRKLSTDLTRIFNVDILKYGGRFYPRAFNPQQRSKDERKTILINGKPTVNPDFKSYHVSFLYHAENIKFDIENNDPYLMVNENKNLRPIIKLVINTMLNARDTKSTIKGIYYSYFMDTIKKLKKGKEALFLNDILFQNNTNLQKLIDDTLKVHKPIAKYFSSGVGSRLQWYDSSIANYTLQFGVANSIPIYPVHDEFIMPVKYEDLVVNEIKEAYKEQFKQYCSLK